MDGYESVIGLYYQDLESKIENGILTAVRNVGVVVDKDELLRAEKEVWKHNEAHLLEDLEILYKENEILVARRGDINDDGLFTVADAVLLMRYVAGTIDTIPYKKIN